MNPFNIVIDNKEYEYLKSITLDNKYYVAFMDEESTYIKEYKIVNEVIELFDVSDEIAQKVWEMI